jgi:hypothetical protein
MAGAKTRRNAAEEGPFVRFGCTISPHPEARDLLEPSPEDAMSDASSNTGYALSHDELDEAGSAPSENLRELVSGEFYAIEEEPLSAPPPVMRPSGVAPAVPAVADADLHGEGPPYARDEEQMVFALDWGPEDEEAL